ncbi:hypothetical protein PS893_00442 [Pseudomonas fluorescens]|uniref:Rid family hydrolase n=1 Tax=Pseudomonas fluorescens TaxID=294 RepID=UPI001252E287|nr:hypothetical protein PS893_00442 [Pseudomonas fluorescens]
MVAISSPNAPLTIGSYSQARVYQGLLFISGQLPINPETQKIEVDDSVAQNETVP